jgi:tyrosyl-tRNA synthetase
LDEQFPDHIVQQAARLRRGTQDIVPANGLEEKLLKADRTGKPLKIKLGLDPTAPDIHLGFAVVLRKLRQFQDLGHEVIIIIGDYTALIGDPSGRSATRPMLTREEIESNAATYVNQLARILDKARTQVRFNGEWLGKLDFAQIVWLTSKMSVAQVLQRDDFANRFSQHQEIRLHELLYPLAQAYDSVAIEADVEMGGRDQTFNILAGRDLQRELGQDPQVALFMPLLVGLDGIKKMSKSLGNYVGIMEPALDQYSKLMSISDGQMRDYFVLCTDVELAEIDRLLGQAEGGSVHPMEVKHRLACEIVTLYHGAEAAAAADAEWRRIHSERQLPSEMPEVEIPADAIKDGRVWIIQLLKATGMAKSNSDAKRVVEQGGVVLGEAKITDPNAEPTVEELRDAVLRVGPRRYMRLKTSPLPLLMKEGDRPLTPPYEGGGKGEV